MSGHPYRQKAAGSSRDKFRAITGVAGGGHAHEGSSHLKKPGANGVHRHWSGHAKTHILEGKAHGGRSRPRADKYARGGRTKAPENVTINIVQKPDQQGQRPPMPPPMPPAAPPAGGAPPPPPPMGGGAPGAPGGANPLQGLGKGLGFARGGRTKGAHGGRPAGSAAAAGHGKGRSIGDSNYDLSHWRGYANADRQKLASSRSGLVQSHTQGVDKVQERARGGRMKMTAGAMSGVGRLEQAEFQKRHHSK